MSLSSPAERIWLCIRLNKAGKWTCDRLTERTDYKCMAMTLKRKPNHPNGNVQKLTDNLFYPSAELIWLCIRLNNAGKWACDRDTEDDDFGKKKIKGS